MSVSLSNTTGLSRDTKVDRERTEAHVPIDRSVQFTVIDATLIHSVRLLALTLVDVGCHVRHGVTALEL